MPPEQKRRHRKRELSSILLQIYSVYSVFASWIRWPTRPTRSRFKFHCNSTMVWFASKINFDSPTGCPIRICQCSLTSTQKLFLYLKEGKNHKPYEWILYLPHSFILLLLHLFRPPTNRVSWWISIHSAVTRVRQREWRSWSVINGHHYYAWSDSLPSLPAPHSPSLSPFRLTPKIIILWTLWFRLETSEEAAVEYKSNADKASSVRRRINMWECGSSLNDVIRNIRTNANSSRHS